MLFPNFGQVVLTNSMEYEENAINSGLLDIQTDTIYVMLGLAWFLYFITIVYMIIKVRYFSKNDIQILAKSYFEQYTIA